MERTSTSDLDFNPDRASKPLWLSANPDRAWSEKYFLLYSPVWMLLMGLMMVTGWVNSFSDRALLLHSLVVATPLFIVPAILRSGKNPQNRWYQSYWFKANLYIGIFGFFGNYVGSEYFFDVLGMVYNLPNASTQLSAELVGRSDQPVPLIMYLYTHAYFMTYHTTAVLVLRRLKTSGLPFSHILFMPLVLVVGYIWAWLETKAMANPLMETTFYYTNMDAMLAYGSLVYALYFMVSFPVFYFLDENSLKPWSLTQVTTAALSTSMLLFYLLDGTAFWLQKI